MINPMDRDILCSPEQWDNFMVSREWTSIRKSTIERIHIIQSILNEETTLPHIHQALWNEMKGLKKLLRFPAQLREIAVSKKNSLGPEALKLEMMSDEDVEMIIEQLNRETT